MFIYENYLLILHRVSSTPTCRSALMARLRKERLDAIRGMQ